MRSPIAIPQSRAGRHFVLHETMAAGWRVYSRSARTAMLLGGGPESQVLTRPLQLHKLLRLTREQLARIEAGESIEGERAPILMTDHPCELRWMQELAAGAAGRVLVAGLGLGIVVELLAARPEVAAVDVVEIEPEVVALTRPHLSAAAAAKVRLVVADVGAFLRSCRSWPWDLAILDTWSTTDAKTLRIVVEPLLALVRERFGERAVRCWCEAEMRALAARASAP